MNKLIFAILLFASFNFVVSERVGNYSKKIPGEVGLRYGFGKSVKLDEFPFFGFFSIFQQPNKPPVCSGSIIHPKWILTSARCIKNITRYKKNIIFTPGKVDSNFTHQANYWDHYYPNVFIVHEDFEVVAGKGEHSVHDIGLARLMTGLRLSLAVQPIQLAHDDNASGYRYRYGTFVEWGSYPDEDLVIPMEVASAKLCILGRHECIAKTLNMIINDELHVCGFDNDEHIRACRSDDGSPLILNKVQIGVATVTVPMDECVTGKWRPIVFTRVSTHISWIKAKMSQYSDYI